MTRARLLGCMLFGLCLTLAGSLGVAVTEAQAQGWEPQKPIELVIMAGKGGGADKMARRFKRIIEDEELLPVELVPVNKPENSGAEALAYMAKNSGNPHVIMVTLNSFYTTPLRRTDLGVDINKFTPIGRMAEDTFVLWVHADSGINSLEEFVEAAKAKGKDWIMAGTGKSSEDNLLTDFLNAAYGLNMTYVPFKGGGRVAKELAQKKANSTVNNPAEQEDFYLEGKTRPLAVFTPERLDMFTDVPTFGEKGRNMVYFMQRSIVGAPGISKEAEAFYQELFREVYESKDWQDYMNQASLRGHFLTGDELKAYWLQERDIHRDMLAKMGEIN